VRGQSLRASWAGGTGRGDDARTIEGLDRSGKWVADGIGAGSRRQRHDVQEMYGLSRSEGERLMAAQRKAARNRLSDPREL
jgi:hypothetical protein